MKQGFVKHFQNLNPKLARIGIHGLIELEDLYHEMVRILDRFNKQIYREKKIKMRIQIVVNVIPISIAHVQSQCRNPNLAKCGGEAQHLEKLGIGSPPGLPNVQSSTAGPKTPRIGVFLVSLERS